jgi:hypothetical protein
MKYAIENGSGAMIQIKSFVKIGSGIQQLIEGIHSHHGDCVSVLYYLFQNKQSKVKLSLSLA